VTTAAELSIPQSWDAITPSWMTTALAIHHAGAVVDTVRVALRDDGTNRRARLELTYSAGSGPPTVFAKAVDPAHAELVALTSGLYHEPRLFSSGVPLPLDHPTVYTAPWLAEFSLYSQARPIYEFACHEGNYALPNMLRGYRATERQATKPPVR